MFPRKPVKRLPALQTEAGPSTPPKVVLFQLPPAQAAWQQHVYQMALAKARAALAPPRYVRLFLASMN